MKRFVSVFFTVLLVLSLCCPVLAFGAIGREQDMVPLLQENKYNQKDFSLSDLQVDTSTMTQLQRDIYDTLINHNQTLSMSKYGMKNRDFQIIYVNLINDHPELFYVSGTYSYSYNKYSNNLVSVSPCYILNQAETEQAKGIFEAGVNRALHQVDDSMTDVQKALTIHEYFCNIATYPYLGSNMEYDNEFYHSAYGIFYDGNTVCAGYALSYSVVMNALGIPCKYVSSEAMAHAWNVIQIDGKWYHIDTTFDDFNLEGYEGKNIQSTNFHTCFLKSDTALATEKAFSHTDYNMPEGITCTDTTYDDYFWDNTLANVYVQDGDYIYVDYDMNTRLANIIKRTVDGRESVVNKIELKAYSLGTISGINLNFAKLVRYKGQLYFTAMEDYITKLFYIDFENNELLQIDEMPSYCFSIGEKDNELYYVTYPNRNTFETNTVSRNNKELFEKCYPNILIMDVNNDYHVNAKDYVHIFKN